MTTVVNDWTNSKTRWTSVQDPLLRVGVGDDKD